MLSHLFLRNSRQYSHSVRGRFSNRRAALLSKGNVKSYPPKGYVSRRGRISWMSADRVRMNRVPGGPTGRSMEPRPICRCAPELLPAYIPARYSRRIPLAAGLTISSAGFNLPMRGGARPFYCIHVRYDK